MRARWWLIALLGLSVPASAAPLPQDTNAIETCLAAVAAGLGAECVGRVADDCIKAVTDDDTSGTKAKACAARELAVWDEQMRAAIKKINAGGFKNIAAATSQAQKTWRTSREKLCPIFEKTDPGSFVGGANYCRLHETGRRALILRKLGEAVSEH
jgi:lysozyme inhibitor LprI